MTKCGMCYRASCRVVDVLSHEDGQGFMIAAKIALSPTMPSEGTAITMLPAAPAYQLLQVSSHVHAGCGAVLRIQPQAPGWEFKARQSQPFSAVRGPQPCSVGVQPAASCTSAGEAFQFQVSLKYQPTINCPTGSCKEKETNRKRLRI